MKIVFFTDTYKPQVNGVVTSIEFFSEELKKMGHEIYIFCPKDKKMPKEENVYTLRSFKFKSYPEYRIGIPSAKIMKIMKRIKPDIVHIHGLASVGFAGLSVAKYMRIPIIMTYHTHVIDYTQYLSKRKFFEKYNKKMIKRYIKWFFNKADIVIAPSNPIRDILIDCEINKPVIILPTGIKIKNIEKMKKFRKPTILHVGRIIKEKGIDSIIKAFAEITKKIDARLIITSDGPYKKNLEKLIESKRLKNVEFTGYIRERKIIELYKKSHVFACASKTETQGLVVLEAMAYGCPVVVANYLGFRDFIKNGENGLLFDEDWEIPEKIIKIINDKKLREKIIKNGYKTAQKYTIKKCAKRLENIYKSLVNKK